MEISAMSEEAMHEKGEGEGEGPGGGEEPEFLPTRESLLTRLKDWGDQDGWREFFDTYWRFIFNVARRTGLTESEAQDVVQETLLGVAKRIPEFRYDPSKGSFKGWLMLNVRSRIAEHWRRRARRDRHQAAMPPESESGTGWLERVPEAGGAVALEAVWQQEWDSNLLKAAVDRTKVRVSARQFLIFDLATLKETPVTRVARTLGINVAQVYLAKHRVGRVMREELARLRRQAESGS